MGRYCHGALCHSPLIEAYTSVETKSTGDTETQSDSDTLSKRGREGRREGGREGEREKREKRPAAGMCGYSVRKWFTVSTNPRVGGRKAAE